VYCRQLPSRKEGNSNLPKPDNSLIHAKPRTQTLHRPQLRNTRHEYTNTSTRRKARHGTEGENLCVRGVRIYFEREPEGEEEDGVEERDDGDRVPAAEAVSEVGGEDTADDGAAAKSKESGPIFNEEKGGEMGRKATKDLL